MMNWIKNRLNINRNFLLLWQGLTTSSLATNFFYMFGIFWLVEEIDSASLVGAFMLAGGLSFALFTPLGGVLVDRFSRRNILVAVDLLSGITILGVTGLFFLSDNISLLITGLFITQIILGACSGFFMPCVFALAADILPTSGLARGNAIINITNSTSQILGRGVTGVLFLLLATPILLLVTGVCFLLSALSESFINVPALNKKSTTRTSATTLSIGANDITQGVITDIREGINYILTSKGMTKAFLLQVGLVWCLSAQMVNTPFLTQSHFAQTTAWFGYFLAGLSAGFVVGSFFTVKQFSQLTGLNSRVYLLKYALVGAPLFCLGLAFTQSVYMALVLFFLQGICQSIINVTTITQIQATTPERLRGRAISVYTMIITIVAALSGVVVGLTIDIMDKQVVLVQWAIGTLGCLLIYPLMINKNLYLFIGHSSTPLTSHNGEEIPSIAEKP